MMANTIRRGRRLLLPLVVAGVLSPTGAASATSPELQTLFTDYERFSTTHPIETGRSDQPSARLHWPMEAPQDLAARTEALKALKARLGSPNIKALTGEDALNRDYMARLIDWRLDGLAMDEHRFAFVAHDGFYNVPYYTARGLRTRTEAEAQAWIERLTAIPAYFEQQQANLQRGVATGWTHPDIVVRVAMDVLGAQTRRAIEDDALLAPLEHLASTIPERRRRDLRLAAIAALRDHVRPAQLSALAYIEGPYRAAARPALGINTVPNGRAYYDFLLSYYTTTDMTAEQIHALGLSEVARIRKEMDAVIAETGFQGDFAAWLEFLRTDPQFYATSRQALLDQAAIIAKRIDGVLPAWFSQLPRQPFAVEAVPLDVEENYTTARYGGGDFAAGQPGRFLVNTSHLDQRPLYELPALALHEAAPGHHTHMALAKENPELPSFRQARDMLAYREGWALYAERLGHEMGVYRSPYERFGSLSTEMWRACRMVVDTGIHALGWTYEQARACFTENSALADINIDTELARYIGAPAGAVAYKLGELKIIDLRRRAETALGEAFDIRAYHDLILQQGQLPLDQLEAVVNDWIALKQAS